MGSVYICTHAHLCGPGRELHLTEDPTMMYRPLFSEEIAGFTSYGLCQGAFPSNKSFAGGKSSRFSTYSGSLWSFEK